MLSIEKNNDSDKKFIGNFVDFAWKRQRADDFLFLNTENFSTRLKNYPSNLTCF